MPQHPQIINSTWQPFLKNEFEQDYFQKLWDFVEQQYQTKDCYPPKNQIFNAFELCSFSDVKVVILGQDPYHGEGQAHGLAFSINEGIKIPPSLRNIFKELKTDVGKDIPESGNLSHWAKQGVLMLNAVLTVETNSPKSHQKQGWEKFTDAVIRYISDEKDGVVFLLWGGDAKKKKKLIDANKHCILESGHPSPLSAIRGHWFANHSFSKCNNHLKSIDKTPIQW